MKIYNTLTRKIETIKPYHPPQLGFYACGPTVYDYAHLGHLRKYVMDDILVRTLKDAGFEVKFVQNITDVGHLASDADVGPDKMEKGAEKYQTSVHALAKKFEDYFFYSMDEMGNLRPDISCRATEHIEQQLALVRKLEKKGFAYVIEGDGVYFDTSQLEDYGKLAGLEQVELEAGARVEPVAGKKNPTDFALWKFERPGEERAMSWASPWAEKSFPGWHIECSAMSMEYLGQQFEIHTGGIDHIPVHHTNEIAQAEAATDQKPFVKYWVHHNFLQVEGEKMSKSLENFYTIDDVKARGFTPRALRLLFLSAHYRSEMNFTWNSLAGAEKSYQKLKSLMLELDVVEAKSSQPGQEYEQRFFAALENDLKTPEAVAILWEVVKSDLPLGVKKSLLLEFDQVLALGLDQVEAVSLPAEIEQLVAQRQAARQDQDWALADQLREQLEVAGYQVEDLPEGRVKVFKASPLL